MNRYDIFISKLNLVPGTNVRQVESNKYFVTLDCFANDQENDESVPTKNEELKSQVQQQPSS